MPMPKVYIGDGAYAMWNGYAFVLTTSNGVVDTNSIVLELEHMKALMEFVSHITKGVIKQETH